MRIAISLALALWAACAHRSPGFSPDEPRWPARPVLFVLNSDSIALEPKVRACVEFWNAAVPGIVMYLGTLGGWEFEVMRKRGSPAATIEIGQVPRGCGGVTTVGHEGSRILRAALVLPAHANEMAVCHEMGHALGLAHDTRRRSVMQSSPLAHDFIVTAATQSVLRRWYKGPRDSE